MTFKTQPINAKGLNPATLLAQAMELELQTVVVVGQMKDGKQAVALCATPKDVAWAISALQFHMNQMMMSEYAGELHGPEGMK